MRGNICIQEWSMMSSALLFDGIKLVYNIYSRTDYNYASKKKQKKHKSLSDCITRKYKFMYKAKTWSHLINHFKDTQVGKSPNVQ